MKTLMKERLRLIFVISLSLFFLHWVPQIIIRTKSCPMEESSRPWIPDTRKVAFVTGGDSGIVRVVCNCFALEGATVAFTYVKSQEEKDTKDTLQMIKQAKTRHALKHMKEGSSIINTTSVNAYKGKPKLLDYTSTKGAIVAFTRGLALQLVSKRIRVNGVAPGPVWTPLTPTSFSD